MQLTEQKGFCDFCDVKNFIRALLRCWIFFDQNQQQATHVKQAKVRILREALEGGMTGRLAAYIPAT